MILGHIPLGYVVTTKLQRKLGLSRWLWVGLVGSVFPDFDVFYFYLVDQRQHLHHGYWTHLPFDWLVISAAFYAVCALFKKTEWMKIGTLFFANVFGHLLADTIVGKIEWLYPFSLHSYSLFTIEPRYSWWVLNFIFHWTFGFEIVFIVWAGVLLWKRNTMRKSL